jgi:SH3 domain-containing YSC84-like protein 1
MMRLSGDSPAAAADCETRVSHNAHIKEATMTHSLAGKSSLAVCAILAAVMLPPARAESPAKAEPPGVAAEQHVAMAEKTFQDFMQDPGQDYFRRSLAKARGVLIVPQSWRLGFIFGGSGGKGVLVARDESGKWGGPAFYTLGNGSVGLQIGFQLSEFIVLAMTQKAIDSLMSSNFRAGVDAAIAAGPVGTGVQSSFQADFITVYRSKGFYAGANLDGSVISANDAWNQGYYDKPTTPVDILVRHVSNPKAEGLLNAVSDAVAHAAEYDKAPGPKPDTAQPKSGNAAQPKPEKN